MDSSVKGEIRCVQRVTYIICAFENKHLLDNNYVLGFHRLFLL